MEKVQNICKLKKESIFSKTEIIIKKNKSLKLMKNLCPSSFTNKRTVWSGVVCTAAREGSLYIHTPRPSKAVGNGTPSIREGGRGIGQDVKGRRCSRITESLSKRKNLVESCVIF